MARPKVDIEVWRPFSPFDFTHHEIYSVLWYAQTWARCDLALWLTVSWKTDSNHVDLCVVAIGGVRDVATQEVSVKPEIELRQ